MVVNCVYLCVVMIISGFSDGLWVGCNVPKWECMMEMGVCV